MLRRSSKQKLRAYAKMANTWAYGKYVPQQINSVYPNVHRCVRQDLNRKVWYIDECNNSNPILQIMWTPVAVNSEDPCHFVPILKVVRKYWTYNEDINYSVKNNLQMFVMFS